jgi:ABC-type polysaccharide/polyol phosphate export permease
MNQLKRFLGILWMLIGPLVFILLLISAIQNINGSVKGDISNPIPWIIILAIFAPIAVGLTIFGWYSWRGDYDERKL